MTDDSMTLKTINFSRTAYTRAIREEFQGTAVIVSSVIAFLYSFTISIKSFNIPSLLFKCKDTKFLSQIQILEEEISGTLFHMPYEKTLLSISSTFSFFICQKWQKLLSPCMFVCADRTGNKRVCIKGNSLPEYDVSHCRRHRQ